MRHVLLFLVLVIFFSGAISATFGQPVPPAASTTATAASTGIAAAVNNLVTNLSQAALPFLGAMAAIGTLSMAIIQAVKNMFPLLRIFQQSQLNGWLRNKAHEAPSRLKSMRPTDSGLTSSQVKTPDIEIGAQEDLVKLATAGDANAFYGLPIEQLCGQMNAAAQIVLQYPEDHWPLLLCLASLASEADLELLVNRTRRRDIEAKLQGARTTGPDSVSLSVTDRATAQDLVDARARVTNTVQRSIDGLQIAVGSRWKFWLQVAAFVLSSAILLIAVYLSPVSFRQGANPLMLIVTAIAAGFLAPVARDLVASLEQLRKA